MPEYLNQKPVEPGKVRKGGMDRRYTRFPKLDGIHVIVHVDVGGTIKTLSRTGETLYALSGVAREYVERGLFKPGYVYFSEAWSPDLPFPEISGACRRQKELVGEAIQLYPFDVVTQVEYMLGDSKLSWFSRTDQLRQNPDVPQHGLTIQPLLQEVDQETAIRMTARKQDLPGPKDGIILRDILGAFYLGPATKGEVVKLKPRPTHDLLVTGTTPGKGKYTGMIGALVVQTGTNKFCEVGTGLTDDMRRQPGADFVGLIAEVSTLGVNKSGKLREPALLRWRLDKTLGDMPADE